MLAVLVPLSEYPGALVRQQGKVPAFDPFSLYILQIHTAFFSWPFSFVIYTVSAAFGNNLETGLSIFEALSVLLFTLHK